MVPSTSSSPSFGVKASGKDNITLCVCFLCAYFPPRSLRGRGGGSCNLEKIQGFLVLRQHATLIPLQQPPSHARPWPVACLHALTPSRPHAHLLVHHHVAHALSGCLPQLVMVLKHVVLDVWQGLLLKDLLPRVGGVEQERLLSLLQ